MGFSPINQPLLWRDPHLNPGFFGATGGEMSPGRSWARARAVQRHCQGLPRRPLAPHVFGEVAAEENWRCGNRNYRGFIGDFYGFTV